MPNAKQGTYYGLPWPIMQKRLTAKWAGPKWIQRQKKDLYFSTICVFQFTDKLALISSFQFVFARLPCPIINKKRRASPPVFPLWIMSPSTGRPALAFINLCGQFPFLIASMSILNYTSVCQVFGFFNSYSAYATMCKLFFSPSNRVPCLLLWVLFPALSGSHL